MVCPVSLPSLRITTFHPPSSLSARPRYATYSVSRQRITLPFAVLAKWVTVDRPIGFGGMTTTCIAADQRYPCLT